MLLLVAYTARHNVVSCGLIEADYGGSLKHSLGPFLIHEGDQNQTAHAQYRYTRNDIIVHTLHTIVIDELVVYLSMIVDFLK